MRERPFPVKLFCGLIGKDEHLVLARDHLEGEFGPVDSVSPMVDFDFTDYYDEEMGPGLSRQWISFAGLKERAYLAKAKHLSVMIEDRLRIGGRRTANIDPGYLDNAQVVLSTAKNFAHRIYIGWGYYAEVTLIFVGGAFRFVEWTYPDYRSREALEFFVKMRASYHREMRRPDEG